MKWIANLKFFQLDSLCSIRFYSNTEHCTTIREIGFKTTSDIPGCRKMSGTRTYMGVGRNEIEHQRHLGQRKYLQPKHSHLIPNAALSNMYTISLIRSRKRKVTSSQTMRLSQWSTKLVIKLRPSYRVSSPISTSPLQTRCVNDSYFYCILQFNTNFNVRTIAWILYLLAYPTRNNNDNM